MQYPVTPDINVIEQIPYWELPSNLTKLHTSTVSPTPAVQYQCQLKS